MTRRIRELEDGLGAVYSTISTEKHPLLSGEDTSTQGSSSVDVPMPRPPRCLVGTKGDSCFYGATARGEVSAAFFVPNSRRHSRPSYFQHTRLSERILSVPFPEASPEQIAPEIRRMVYEHLPPYEDARGTCELFLNYSSYMSSSLTREELLHVLETVYNDRSADPEPATHHLGLLFIVLALSKLLYGEENYTVDSQDYFVLSRVYMAEYLVLSDVHIDPTGCARAWMYIGMAMKLAHSVNLGGARFRLEQHEIKRRDRVFWHLFSSDVWASFTSGRPPSTSLRGSDGEKFMGFFKLLSQVMATAFTSRPPSYAAILDLDRKLRIFTSSDSLLWVKRWVSFQQEWALTGVGIALLNIHRAYFAQALPPNFQFFRTNFASSKVLSVVFGPQVELSEPALEVLNKAVALFETGIESGSIHLSENMVEREAVRNLHREAREAVEKGRSSDEPYTPLRARARPALRDDAAGAGGTAVARNTGTRTSREGLSRDQRTRRAPGVVGLLGRLVRTA
ncbi:hypothetical protein EI94DRAFT_1714113 [Lactarius quietus]|nr:hypothetical protein EI94DRAFT_1714113 [Lactarius quietus]